MRARIVLLWDTPPARALMERVQQVLADVAVAFGHSFLLREERMGEASRAAYGSHMTVEAIEACRAADACAALLTAQDGLLELAEGLDCVLGCHLYEAWPAGAVEAPLASGLMPQGAICYPLYGDSRLNRAAELAYGLASPGKRRVREIPFDASLRDAWLAATLAPASAYAATAQVRATVEDVLGELIEQPEQLGVVFAKPQAARTLRVAADALSGSPASGYIRFMGETCLHAWAGGAPLDAGQVPPGALAAAADLLRTSLHLTREADCVLAAVANVNETALHGEGGGDMDAWERVSQQIALVGELLHPRR